MSVWGFPMCFCPCCFVLRCRLWVVAGGVFPPLGTGCTVGCFVPYSFVASDRHLSTPCSQVKCSFVSHRHFPAGEREHRFVDEEDVYRDDVDAVAVGVVVVVVVAVGVPISVSSPAKRHSPAAIHCVEVVVGVAFPQEMPYGDANPPRYASASSPKRGGPGAAPTSLPQADRWDPAVDVVVVADGECQSQSIHCDGDAPKTQGKDMQLDRWVAE